MEKSQTKILLLDKTFALFALYKMYPLFQNLREILLFTFSFFLNTCLSKEITLLLCLGSIEILFKSKHAYRCDRLSVVAEHARRPQ